MFMTKTRFIDFGGVPRNSKKSGVSGEARKVPKSAEKCVLGGYPRKVGFPSENAKTLTTPRETHFWPFLRPRAPAKTPFLSKSIKVGKFPGTPPKVIKTGLGVITKKKCVSGGCRIFGGL